MSFNGRCSATWDAAMPAKRQTVKPATICHDSRPPELIDQRERIHNLSDESFIRRLEELGGTPAEVLQNKELLELLMPTLRADFAVIDTYKYTPGAPLACPITVVSGSADLYASGPTMEGWRLQTSDTLSFHELQGGHFFIHALEHELRQIVASDLERLIAPGHGFNTSRHLFGPTSV